MSGRRIAGAYRAAVRPPHPLLRPGKATLLEIGPIVAGGSDDFGSPGASEGVTCLLDGRLHDTRPLAAELGVPAGIGDESLAAAAFRHWGEGALSRLSGDFSLLVWAAGEEEGLIGRSRSGLSSMFACVRGRSVHFATELADLLALLPSAPPPDEVAVARALGGWTMHGGRTHYAGVRRLLPGEMIRLGRRAPEVRRFWRPTPPEPASISRAEAVEEVRRLIGDTVDRAVDDDDEVGVLLSGGIDSSTVAAVGSRALALRGKRLRGYCAQFPEVAEADESEELDLLAGELPVPQTRMQLSGGSPFGAAIEFMRAWRVPLGPPNHFVWEPFLARAAGEGITAMLGGDGGDEVFASSPYLISDRVRAGRLPSALRLTRRTPAAGSGPRSFLAAMARWGVLDPMPALGARRARSAPRALLPSAASLFREGEDRQPWQEWDGPRWWAYKAHLIFAEAEALGVGDYWRRATAMAGLRASHPLSDPRLVDFVMSLPPEWSFDRSLSRPLLREAALGAVPDRVRLKRGKAVFGHVFSRSLVESDLPVIVAMLESPSAEVYRYLDRSRVRDELLRGPRLHPAGEAEWALEIWRVATVECWLKALAEPESAAALQESCHRRSRESRTFFSLDRTLGSA